YTRLLRESGAGTANSLTVPTRPRRTQHESHRRLCPAAFLIAYGFNRDDFSCIPGGGMSSSFIRPGFTDLSPVLFQPNRIRDPRRRVLHFRCTCRKMDAPSSARRQMKEGPWLPHGSGLSLTAISGAAMVDSPGAAAQERSYVLAPSVLVRATDSHVRSHANGSDWERQSARRGEGRDFGGNVRSERNHCEHRDGGEIFYH